MEKIGKAVYLKTGDDKQARLITAINIREKSIQYELSCGEKTSWHYAFEFTDIEPKKKIMGLKI